MKWVPASDWSALLHYAACESMTNQGLMVAYLRVQSSHQGDDAWGLVSLAQADRPMVAWMPLCLSPSKFVGLEVCIFR